MNHKETAEYISKFTSKVVYPYYAYGDYYEFGMKEDDGKTRIIRLHRDVCTKENIGKILRTFLKTPKDVI